MADPMSTTAPLGPLPLDRARSLAAQHGQAVGAVLLAPFVLLVARCAGADEIDLETGGGPDRIRVEIAADQDFHRLVDDVRHALWPTPDPPRLAVRGAGLEIRFTTDDQGISGTFTAGGAAPTREHYLALLTGMLDQPDRPVREIPTLPADELAERAEWNDTAADLPSDSRLEELFLRRVRTAPDRHAVICAQGAFTYAEVELRSRALAADLRQRGVGRGSQVAVVLERGWQQVVAVLAVLRAGAAYLPMEPDWPIARLRGLVARCRCAVVLTQPEVRPRLVGIGADDVIEVTRAAVRDVAAPPTRGQSAADVAYVIFTSGSTGEPKGVVVEHRAAVNTILDIARRFGVAAGDRVLAVSALSFDLSVFDVFGMLAAGGAVVIPEPEAARDPACWARWVREAGVTVWNSVPALLDLLVSAAAELGSVRLALLSGDWISVGLPDRFRALAPDAEIVSLGGATEGAIWSIAYPIDRVDPAWESIPYGRPLANQRFHVLDQHQQPVPVGVVGQLHIAGAGLARGYWDDPDRTAASFVVDPESGERRYRTGDYGAHRADGVIEFRGRRDQQVKVRGYRVELGEIEAVLRGHDEVRDVAVLARRGVGEPVTLAAYVEPVAGPDDGSAERRRVADWAGVFDSLYAGATEHAEPREDFVGWTDPRTGLPIPRAEMSDWADRTAALVLACLPRRVLEVGCGSGILLTRVAPSCEAYHGVDSSAAAISRLRADPAVGADARVRLAVAHAADLSIMDSGSVDTVLLNSVVQYFPSAGYLVRVLRECSRVLAPGGRIVVGDVRNLALLDALHASIEWERAEPGGTVGEVLARVEARSAREDELVLDPRFFGALGAELPRLTGVETHVKEAPDRNDLTLFRFDVILRFDTACAVPAPRLPWSDLGRDGLRARLAAEPESLAVLGIPDERVRRAVRLSALRDTGDRAATVAEAAARAEQAPAPDSPSPRDLRELGAAFGYAVRVSCSGDRPGHLDVTYRKNGGDGGTAPRARADWAALANRPVADDEDQVRIGRWRTHLRRHLPHYMVPAVIVAVPRMPLTANGKLDRGALPDAVPRASADGYVPPAGPAQRLLAELWAAGLGVERVGVHENFLDLGGDSIRGLRIIAELTRNGYALSADQFFRAPTIAEQAAVLTRVPLARPQGTVTGPIPLTPVQQGMLLRYLADPGRGLYVVQARYAIDGTLDESTFRDAVDDVVRRHEILRCAVRWSRSGEPELAAAETASMPVRMVDLRGRTSGDQHVVIERQSAEERTREVDLDRAPLARMTLFRLEHCWELVFTFHHLVLDGWSVALLEAEIAQTYTARAAGRVPATAVAAPFRSYVRWLTDRACRAGDEVFWRTSLSALGSPTSLVGPSNRTAPDLDEVPVPLPAATAAALAEFGRRHRLTFTTLAHGAWAAVLAHHTGQDEVVFGVAVSGRPDDLPDTGLGCHVATIPMPVTVPHGDRLTSWLAAVQSWRVDSRPHEHTSLRTIAQCGPPAAGEPMFDSVVISEIEQAATTGTGFALRRRSLRGRTEWPVAVLVAPGRTPGLTIQYDSARLAVSRARVFARHFAAVLGAIAHGTATTVGDLPTHAPQDGPAVLSGPSAPVPDHPVDDLVAAQARRGPDRVAVVCGARAITYRGLDQAAERLARRLRRLGAGPGSLVGVLAPRGIGLVTMLLAVLKSGAGYVPLDPRYPVERLRYMLAHSGAALLIGDGTVPDPVRAIPGLAVLDTTDDTTDDTAEPAAPAAPPRSPDDTAYVIYTSGSTGVPKGVQVSHRSLTNLLTAMASEPGISAEDRLLSVTTVSFDIAVLELFLPLTAGARLVVADDAEAADGFALAKLVGTHDITLMQATPTSWRMLLDCGWTGAARLVCLSGGEPLPEELAADLLARTAAVWNLYGPTETTIWSTVHRVESGTGTIPIGRPVANTTVFLLDRRLRSVPSGATGEVCIAGAGLARGYWRDPDGTSLRFVRHPGTGERLYRTGDLARLTATGTLEFVGRADAQVKIRGVRVEPGEVEAALLRHPGVRSAAAAVRGADPAILVGYVVPVAAAPGPESLRRFLSGVLPAHAIPGRFVVLESLPRTPNGKLDRAALPDPGPGRPAIATDFAVPRSVAEQTIAEVWCAVLGLAEVGVRDDYFELGGDSLGVLRIVTLARRRGLRITPRQVIDRPTVAELAAVAETAGAAPEHDRQSVRTRAADSGYTPADFPLARLTGTELDHVLSALGRTEEPPHG
ncbi:amino acid adenylation domain-containing protein [Actinokineospora sp.]|uniref:amino acid adenylation domain-containing protein n=1 Tax=Actinokineospora sp. TaxID=1872133 RepID=UPI00403822C7